MNGKLHSCILGFEEFKEYYGSLYLVKSAISAVDFLNEVFQLLDTVCEKCSLIQLFKY